MDYVITVKPKPTITTSPLNKLICAGSNTSITLEASVVGTAFSWTSSCISGTVTGFTPSGTGEINDILNNTGILIGTVRYVITPTANGCAGPPVNFDVDVNPLLTAEAGLNQLIPFGTNTNLVGSLTGGTAGFTYLWTPATSINGSNLTATVQTINLTTTPTVFTLVITDSKGCSSSDNTTVTLNGMALGVVASANPQVICINSSSVQLDATATGGNSANILTYSWSTVASGIFSIQKNPIVNPTITTVYSVTVNDGFNTATNSVTVTVNPLPEVFNMTGGGEYCAGGTGKAVGLSDSQTGVSYQCYKDAVADGSPITGTGSAISFGIKTAAGAYTAKATNTTTNCPNDMSGSVPITINPLPIAVAGPDQTIPYGISTTLAGSGSGGTGTLSYLWSPSNKIATGEETLLGPHTTNLNETTIFILTVTDSKTCPNSDQVQVIISGNPLSVTVTASPNIICNNDATVQLNAAATGGSGTYSYSWSSSPSGFTSTLHNPTVNPTITTTYTVTANDGYNTATNSVTVTVNPLPEVFNMTGGGEYCAGGTGKAVGLSGSQTGVSYQCYKDAVADGSPITGTGSTISFGNKTDAGLYTVKATNNTTTCWQNMDGSASVIINLLPIVSAGADKIIPHGISTTLSGAASGGSGLLAYNWTPVLFIASGATTLSPTTTNLYANTTYTLTVTDAKECANSDQIEVVINGSPLSTTATVLPDVICDGDQSQLNSTATGGSGTYTYSWVSSPSGFTSTLHNPTVNPTITTTYTVTVNDGYNTANASITVTVNPLPVQYTITPGGAYCLGGVGIPIGLSNSEVGVDYRLFRETMPILTAIPGTGNPITFSNQTVAGNYTIKSIQVATSCVNDMLGTATITINPLPVQYAVTGGGSYPSGGVGVPIGLVNSETGIDYRLVHNTDTLTPAPGLPGTGTTLDFGNQTLAGQYTVAAKNHTTGCTQEMSGSVNVVINPYPSAFNVFGGGPFCFGDPGKSVAVDGSEIGVGYVLKRNNDSISYMLGSGDTLNFGVFNTAGTYTVLGVNIATRLTKWMTGSATIIVNQLPLAYLMVPQGDTCPGTEVLLNGSQSGINYYLIRENDTISMRAGTGVFGLLSFGNQWDTGVYRVVGINALTGCKMEQIGSVIIHIAPAVFNIIPPGILCPGQIINLSGSQIGINYQLRRDSLTNIGVQVPGTGSGLSFGPQFLPGVYRVIAIDPLTHCYSWQNGNSTIQPGPTIYTMVPNGDTCAGGRVRLNGSQIGIQYHLVLNNTVYLDSLYGTGQPLVFGTFLTSGTYKILATDTLTHCEVWMDGMVTVLSSPTLYNVIPNGISCEGSAIGLDGSEIGINYTLIRDNWVIAAGPIPGNGSSISFGLQSYPGSYTIEAQNPISGCSRIMEGVTSLYSRPVSFLLLPQGDICFGTDIYLNGSQIGVNYQLLRDGMVQQTKPGTGLIIHFGSQYVAGIYTIKAINTFSTCDTLMTGTATVLTPPLAFNITPAGANCSPSMVGLTGSQIGINYQLLKNGAISGSTIAGTGNTLDFGLQTEGVYRVVAISPSTSCSDTMQGIVVITPGPFVFAGNDTTICATHSLTAVANASNYSTIHWFTSGDGLFSDPTILGPVYTPGVADIVNGTFSLYIEAHGSQACPSAIAKDTLIVFIHSYPIANAGENDTICFTGSYSLNGMANNYSSVLWATSGDGHFDNLHILNPVYTAGISDKTIGVVTLTLHVHGTQQCTFDTVNDAMTLRIEPLPIANAGPNDTICENMTYRLSGTAQNNSSVLWSTTGDGTFDNAAILIPYYTPGVNDKVAGNVRLALTAIGTQHCVAESRQDTMILFINRLPIVFAGNDDTICANKTFILNASVQRHSSINWSTSGDGTFTNPHIINPIYSPGPSDNNSGLVLLKLTANGLGTCINESTSDSMILKILPMPIANAGNDTLSCPNIPIPLNGSALHFMSVLWTSEGDGVFDDPTLLKSHYTPGNLDIANGYTQLTMTVNGLLQCGAQISTDTVRIDFKALPTATISGTPLICEGANGTITLTLTGVAPWTVTYTDGINTHTINNIPVSPYTFTVSPITTTTYSILSVQDAFCYAQLPLPAFTVQVNPNPNTYHTIATNGGAYCEGGIGVEIEIDGSQTGVFYQLFFSGTPEGLALPGTGSPISFGYKTAPGIYKVKATHPQTLCETMFNDSVIILVFPTPNVDFIMDSTCYKNPTFFHLNGPDISRIALWEWNFGDGNTETYTAPVEPVHTFPTPDIYTISLNVTDTNGCHRMLIHSVSINPLPIALFSHNSPLCLGYTVDFSDQSYAQGNSTLRKWHWDFGDGNDTLIIWPGNPDVSHLYQNSGTYSVTLTVYSNDNCQSKKTNTIEIVPAPLANFSHGDTCVLQNVQFMDQSQPHGGGNIVEWTWNFGDPGSGVNNTATIQNPMHVFHNAGNFLVQLLVKSSNGCIDSIRKTVQTMQQPTAMFTADGICESDSTQFTDVSIPHANSIIEWDWNFGDGSPHSNLQNPIHLYSIPGQFNVSLFIKNSNQCMHDTLIPITIIAKPVVLFNTNAPKCVGTPVSFMNLSTTQHGIIVKWKWSFGDGTDTTIYFPGVPNITHVFQGSATQHLVRLTVTTNDSCSNYHEQIINSVLSPTADFYFSDIRCKGQSVNFTDNTQLNGGGVITSWYWDFADPTSGFQNFSTLQNPIHIFTSANIYQVKLTVTNLNSCTSIVMYPVEISDSPQANFISDTACFGTPSHFTDLSNPNAPSITSWDWNFGDGSIHSYLQNPNHQYASAGIFTVTLIVVNSTGCQHTITKQVKVISAPVASFSYSVNNCNGLPVSFTNLSSTPQGYVFKWTWNFGDGVDTSLTLPSIPNITHVYANPGNYNVTLTIQTNDSCANSVMHQISVGASPVADFYCSQNKCQHTPVNFQDISQPNGGIIISWNWDFGDPGSGANNTSTLQNPWHVYSLGTTYQVKLIVQNINNCYDTIIHPVIISSAPSAHYAADLVCQGNLTHFTDQSVPHSGTLVSWNWNFGDGNTSILQNPTHLYTTAGVFNVSLTVLNSFNCQSDTLGEVVVQSPPNALFEYENSCKGAPIQFHDLSYTPMGVINSWHWNFGDGDSSSLQNPSHIYVTQGIYLVTLTVTNTFGCLSSFSLPVTVYINPTAGYTYFSKYCPQGKVSFTDHSTASNVPIVSWLWIFENGYTSITQNPTYTFSITDTTYLVSLIVTDANGCNDTLIQPVYVVPGNNFTFISDSVCFGEITHFQPVNLAIGDTLHDLRWNFGDPNSGIYNQSVLYDPIHQFTIPGTYIVKLSAYNSDNCQDSIYREVIVYQNPISDFSFDTIPYCDSIVTFHNLSWGNGAAIDSLIWIFGDGDTTVQTKPLPPDVIHQYHNFGSFNVHLKTINAHGCIDNRSKTVLVSCLSAVIVAADSIKCERQTAIFNDNSIPLSLIKQWHWDFGDGMDTTYGKFKKTINHKYASAGDYTVMLVVSLTNNGITLSDTNLININVQSSPIASYLSPSVCFGDSVRFINLSDSNGFSIVSNFWKFGDPGTGIKDTSTTINPSHLYSKSGTFHSMLVVQNSLGCSDTLRRDVKIFKLPEAAFTIPIACTRQHTAFKDESKTGDTLISNWSWSFGDPENKYDSSHLRNPSYIYYQPGKYYLYLKVKDYYGCQDAIKDSVFILESPISAFTYKDNVEGISGKIELLNKSENAIIYDWDFGNGKTSIEENPIISYVEDGSYIIRLVATNKNSCTDTANLNYDFIFHGLYVPNLFSPTSLVYNVRFFKPAGLNLSNYHIIVFDISGHTLWESTQLDNKGSPLEGWDGTSNGRLMPQGTYMWKITATFKDGKVWEGSNTGKGSTTTVGTVTLVR
ncbi:MAG: PKD domain-containing protein [Bacteroidales bacterium]|nr:PKD domain-containing protein [Bacteroidales bacterium]